VALTIHRIACSEPVARTEPGHPGFRAMSILVDSPEGAHRLLAGRLHHYSRGLSLLAALVTGLESEELDGVVPSGSSPASATPPYRARRSASCSASRT